MTLDCEMFTIKAAVDGQEIQKITNEDKIPCRLLVCSEWRRYHSHERLACIAMTNTSKFSFHKCISKRLVHTIQFKFSFLG